MSESEGTRVQPTAEILMSSLRAACAELEGIGSNESREKKAVEALLLALSTHYPTFFRGHCRSSPLLMKYFPKSPTGQVIKLKRQAVAVLASFL